MKEENQQNAYFYLFVLGLYVLLLVLYVYGRFGLNWLNGDALQLTRLSQNVYQAGRIAPISGAYPYGYTYPALNTFLAHLSGATVLTWQSYLQPFLTLILVPISYISFRRLLTTPKAALLASLLLFVQPEFLFETLRSSHAKITWSLALLLLFLLSRSLRSEHWNKGFAAGVLAFYLTAFALITSNSFFASNYIFGIAFAFIAAQILRRLYAGQKSLIPSQMGRLWLVAISCLVLTMLFIFYLYPPALRQFVTLETIIDKLASLFLGVEETSTFNPYAYVEQTWLSQPIYLAVSAANWLVLTLSFAMWLLLGRRFLIRRELLSPPLLLLWLLYAAFALLLSIAVLLDFAGALSANLQVRLFSHLMIVGVPLAAALLLLWLERSRAWSRSARLIFSGALPLLLALLTLGGLFKVTNEPLLSNWWAFYTPGEQHIVMWSGAHLQRTSVWTGDDQRLPMLVDMYGNWRAQQISFERGRSPELSRYYIISTVVEAHAVRLRYSPPDVKPHQQVYDNGQAQLVYSRPQTPFQR